MRRVAVMLGLSAPALQRRDLYGGCRVRRFVVPLASAALLAGCTQPAMSSASESPAPRPSPSHSVPPCPSDGVRLEVGDGDAAMGLRVLGITLINCGPRPYRLHGYPGVRTLAEDRAALRVQVLHGVEKIVRSAVPWDGPPAPVILQPGDRAGTAVAWRNTYDDIRQPPVTVDLLDLAPRAGGPSQLVRPQGGLDLGSTGRIAVSAWRPLPQADAPVSPPERQVPGVSASEPAETTGPLP